MSIASNTLGLVELELGIELGIELGRIRDDNDDKDISNVQLRVS